MRPEACREADRIADWGRDAGRRGPVLGERWENAREAHGGTGDAQQPRRRQRPTGTAPMPPARSENPLVFPIA